VQHFKIWRRKWKKDKIMIMGVKNMFEAELDIIILDLLFEQFN
jgi:hypothetical protein